jgi:RsiW-degrading membrane proteinase PrsW (M82 family)
MPAWRARAHHLTRSRAFLGKTAALVLGVGALVATLLQVSRQPEDGLTSNVAAARRHSAGPVIAVIRESARKLESGREPAPAHLIAWLRECAMLWHDDELKEIGGFDAVALRLGGIELHPLISKHTTSEEQRDAVISYVRFLFLPDGDARTSALHTLQQFAAKTPPALANEMLGDALLDRGQSEEALQAYLREMSTPAATHARKRAFELALMQRDAETLRHLCADARVRSEMNPGDLWNAAKLTGNRPLLFRALWQMQWARWMQGAAVPLALLAAAIWYIILIHTASREPFRWGRYLPGVFAGIASVWLLHWWQGTLNYRGHPDDTTSLSDEILEWIMHVGLPEECAKLVLFAFFLPVLLHHRSGVKAALTAGCVGLGFALDENLHYFLDVGPQVAIGRLLTANFMHLSLTGILGWHLYELFRSRFHHATVFLTVFCAVVAAHGIYDFSLGGAAKAWGFDLAHIIILALCARFYLHLLHENERGCPAGLAISRTAVFVLGTALLGGMVMFVMVWNLQCFKGITLVLEQLVAVALVGLIYIREWRELD